MSTPALVEDLRSEISELKLLEALNTTTFDTATHATICCGVVLSRLNSRSSSKLALVAYLGLAPAGRTRDLIISRRVAQPLSLSSYLLS
jgi:hypothetical protein